MDTNKRKTGLARLIEIAGTKRRLLIGAMLLAVIERVRYCTGLFPFNRDLILLLL